MKNMRKLLLFISIIGLSATTFAQENPKQREVGISFRNFDSFGLTFKTGTEKSAWRFNSLLTNGTNSNNTLDSVSSKLSNFGFGVGIGKEFRKKITEHLEFRYGADVSFNYSIAKSNSNDLSYLDEDWSVIHKYYYPGINLVLGFNYLFNEKIVLGAEILPMFSYHTHINESVDVNDVLTKESTSSFAYGLSNTSIQLSLSYRF
jgi:hypothetical protein